MKGSVPRPLQRLIGRRDQSERTLVVPTMRPCVARAQVCGGQRETTARCSTGAAGLRGFSVTRELGSTLE